jgi:hypothetical protein
MDGEFGNILTMDPEDRDPDQVKEIIERMKDIQFFKDLLISHGKEAVREWCAKLRYCSYKPGENIITYRDLGEEFFVLLEGQAIVYVPMETTLTGPKEIINEYMEENDVLLIPSSDLDKGDLEPYETIEYDNEK